MGGDITFTVEKSYDKRYRRAVRVMFVPWVYSIVMLEDGKEITRSNPERYDYFFGVSRRDTNGTNIYWIFDFISNGIIKYYQESSNTELRYTVYRKVQPILNYIMKNIIGKKLKGDQVVEALNDIFNILKGAVTDADPDVDLKRFGIKILNGMNGINEPRDPSTPVSDSTAATTSSSDVVSGDAGASGHTERDFILMIVPSSLMPGGKRIKVKAADLEELKTEIKKQITKANGSIENIVISKPVPDSKVPVPFKTLDEIKDRDMIQIHKSVQSGGYRENPKRKKRKNTMRKKRKNTMRKKRKNTKRKNTKRKNTMRNKRKNTKRKNTKKR